MVRDKTSVHTYGACGDSCLKNTREQEIGGSPESAVDPGALGRGFSPVTNDSGWKPPPSGGIVRGVTSSKSCCHPLTGVN
jgi:hypothetical protein